MKKLSKKQRARNKRPPKPKRKKKMSNVTSITGKSADEQKAALMQASKAHADEIMKLRSEVAQHQNSYATTFSNLAIQASLKLLDTIPEDAEQYAKLAQAGIDFAEAIRATVEPYKERTAPLAQVHDDVYRHLDHLENQKALIDQKISSLSTAQPIPLEGQPETDDVVTIDTTPEPTAV